VGCLFIKLSAVLGSAALHPTYKYCVLVMVGVDAVVMRKVYIVLLIFVLSVSIFSQLTL